MRPRPAATLVAILLALLFGQLTKRVPHNEGGLYAYARHEFGDFAGYATAWCYWITCWAGNAAIVSSWVLYVEELFGFVADLGAPLLHAHFPRAYLDVNREPYELDPILFRDGLPHYANTQSVRVVGGLGRIDLTGAYTFAETLDHAEGAGLEMTLEDVPDHAVGLFRAVGIPIDDRGPPSSGNGAPPEQACGALASRAMWEVKRSGAPASRRSPSWKVSSRPSPGALATALIVTVCFSLIPPPPSCEVPTRASPKPSRLASPTGTRSYSWSSSIDTRSDHDSPMALACRSRSRSLGPATMRLEMAWVYSWPTIPKSSEPSVQGA